MIVGDSVTINRLRFGGKKGKIIFKFSKKLPARINRLLKKNKHLGHSHFEDLLKVGA